jgi:DNA-binding MarR family transcriptional regulator
MPAPPKKTARALLEVTMLLMRGFEARMRQGERRLEPAHVGILAKTSVADCSVTELAQHQAVRLPTMSKSVALLVERGWLERWTPADNRRQTMVRLTKEGRRMWAWMKRDAERHVAQMLGDLTAAQRAQVEASLKILIETLGRKAASPLKADGA